MLIVSKFGIDSGRRHWRVWWRQRYLERLRLSLRRGVASQTLIELIQEWDPMVLRTFILISFLSACMLQAARAEPEPDRTGQPLVQAATQEAAFNQPDDIDAATKRAR